VSGPAITASATVREGIHVAALSDANEVMGTPEQMDVGSAGIETWFLLDEAPCAAGRGRSSISLADPGTQ
jgi:hypothetical protein